MFELTTEDLFAFLMATVSDLTLVCDSDKHLSSVTRQNGRKSMCVLEVVDHPRNGRASRLWLPTEAVCLCLALIWMYVGAAF